ncbi:MAG: NUDIX domain-containing protein [Candidatus Thermoplasmatota archaeon]
MMDEISAGIVVFRDESPRKYLLLHYPAGHWDFPKGHIEEGEKELETALRELEEETGIEKSELELKEDFKEEIEYFYKKRDELSHKKVIFHLGETEKEEVELSVEHQGFTWLPFEEAKEKVTFRNARNLLEKARDHLEEMD